MSQIFSQGTEVEQEARESTDCPDSWHLLGGRSFPARAFRFSFTLISILEGNRRDYLWSVSTTVPLKSKLSVASTFLRDEIRVSREGGNLLLSGTVHSLFSKIQRFAANVCSHDIQRISLTSGHSQLSKDACKKFLAADLYFLVASSARPTDTNHCII